MATDAGTVILALTKGRPYDWLGAAPSGTPVTVTFSFMERRPDYMTAEEVQDFQPFTAEQAASARLALASWAAVSGLSFIEVPDLVGGDIRFGMSTIDGRGNTLAQAYFPLTPGDDGAGGDIWFDRADHPATSTLAPGSQGFLTLLHEIGHAIGLRHPFEEGATNLPDAEDNTSFTVMSYNVTQVSVVPAIHDVTAVKALYGSEETEQGDGITLAFDPVRLGIVHTGGPSGDVMLGTSLRDRLVAGDGVDLLEGRGGADLLVGGAGDDQLDGGRGIDAALYSGPMADYRVQVQVGGLSVRHLIAGGDGTDMLRSVEIIAFADKVRLTDSRPRGIVEGVDEAFYRADNPDVDAAIKAGLLTSAAKHFLDFGAAEGRAPNLLFDTDWYLDRNPDVAAGVVAGWLTAWGHYAAFGWKEGRDPSPWFDVTTYLAVNTDVTAAGMEPLGHFLAFGLAEGRSAFPVGGDWLV